MALSGRISKRAEGFGNTEMTAEEEETGPSRPNTLRTTLYSPSTSYIHSDPGLLDEPPSPKVHRHESYSANLFLNSTFSGAHPSFTEDSKIDSPGHGSLLSLEIIFGRTVEKVLPFQ